MFECLKGAKAELYVTMQILGRLLKPSPALHYLFLRFQSQRDQQCLRRSSE